MRSHIALLLLLSAPALCQRVTEEARVRIDGRVQRVRKINGRWWSEDNRQLTKPKDGGFIWWITSNTPPEFHHHRPVELSRAESLHLFMDRESVSALLGDANQTLEKAGIWLYYAEDGTELFVRFFGDELGEASYHRSDYGVAGRPVQSIAKELNGRNIYAISADRAWQRSSPESYAKYRGSRSGNIQIVTESHAVNAPAPPRKRIAKELLDAVHEGMTRAEVVSKLGDPSGGLHIGGGGNDTEKLTYALEPAGQATVSFKQGIVVRIEQTSDR
jgi:hypothetical protein